MTLFLTVSWLLWTCLFFGLARAVQESAMEHGVVPATWRDMRGESSQSLLFPCGLHLSICNQRMYTRVRLREPLPPRYQLSVKIEKHGCGSAKPDVMLPMNNHQDVTDP